MAEKIGYELKAGGCWTDPKTGLAYDVREFDPEGAGMESACDLCSLDTPASEAARALCSSNACNGGNVYLTLRPVVREVVSPTEVMKPAEEAVARGC